MILPPAIAWLAALLLLVVSRYAVAQDFERYRPQMPANEEGAAELPEQPGPVGGSQKVLVDRLSGLVVVDRPEQVQPRREGVSGLVIEPRRGLNLLRSQAFRRIASRYLGGPVSIYRLNQLAREIIMLYRRNDQPVVDVNVPEQDITTGVVQIVVTEARIGKIKFRGACYFDPEDLCPQVCASPGEKIFESILLEDLRWLNRNPFRTVDMELSPGSQFGQTDIVFNVHDQRPLRAYAGYEDTGTRETNLERLIFGANWGNALWRDDQFSYQYTSSRDWQSLQAHSAVYSHAFLNRDVLDIYGSYADLAYRVDPQDVVGRAWQAAFRYNKCLRPWVGDNMRFEHRLVGGFDFKQTNTNLEFGGAQVFDSNADIAQMVFGYHAAYRDACGYWAAGNDLFISPGHFSPDNTDVAFQEVRALSRANYIYWRAYIERERNLPWNLLLFGRLTGQVADANLLPSEQLGFGGYNSIRGFDMRDVNGDSGYIVNVEVRTQPYHPGWLSKWRADDRLQFHWFYDIGGAMNRQLLPGESWITTLSGTGLGFRYSAGQNVSLRFDYAWQVDGIEGDNITERPHLAVIIAR